MKNNSKKIIKDLIKRLLKLKNFSKSGLDELQSIAQSFESVEEKYYDPSTLIKNIGSLYLEKEKKIQNAGFRIAREELLFMLDSTNSKLTSK